MLAVCSSHSSFYILNMFGQPSFRHVKAFQDLIRGLCSLPSVQVLGYLSDRVRWGSFNCVLLANRRLDIGEDRRDNDKL